VIVLWDAAAARRRGIPQGPLAAPGEPPLSSGGCRPGPPFMHPTGRQRGVDVLRPVVGIAHPGHLFERHRETLAKRIMEQI